MSSRKPTQGLSDLRVSPEDRLSISLAPTHDQGSDGGNAPARPKAKWTVKGESPQADAGGGGNKKPPRKPRARKGGGGNGSGGNGGGKPPAKKGRKRKWAARLLGWGISLAVWVGIGVGGVVAYYAYDLPDLDTLTQSSPGQHHLAVGGQSGDRRLWRCLWRPLEPARDPALCRKR